MCTDRAVLLLADIKQMLPLIGWYERLAGVQLQNLSDYMSYRRDFRI
jgi:hypothetical protein